MQRRTRRAPPNRSAQLLAALVVLFGTVFGAPVNSQAQDVEVDAPAAILGGIPFSVTVTTPRSLDTLRAVLTSADGSLRIERAIPPVG
ncbi:MAG: hypothetical protein OER90_13020, partial [Gemmatimonadota bacterium]|nr:hypothetical protein [Gemmatimonadota bacterium]